MRAITAVLCLTLVTSCELFDPTASPADVMDMTSREIGTGLPEDCTSVGDEDGDGDADCQDSDCGGARCGPNPDALCVQEPVLHCRGGESMCEDGFDNDADGWKDCEDPDCAMTSACTGIPSACSDACEEDGTFQCTDQRLERCTADERGCLSWVTQESCDEDLLCDATEQACVQDCEDMCAVGDTECQGTQTLSKCTIAPSGCAESSLHMCQGATSCKVGPDQVARCTPDTLCTCTAGATRCDGVTVQFCDPSQLPCWKDARSCTNGCIVDKERASCRGDSCRDECTPGDWLCMGPHIEECAIRGGCFEFIPNLDCLLEEDGNAVDCQGNDSVVCRKYIDGKDGRCLRPEPEPCAQGTSCTGDGICK